MVLEKTLESPLDCKEIQPVHPKGDQSWVFFGRTDAKAEAPILWPPHAKSWLIGKDSDWGQEEKGTTEDEMAGWHHWLDGAEFEWTPGVGDGQGGLACCDSCVRLAKSRTPLSDWTELNWATLLESTALANPDLLTKLPVVLNVSVLQPMPQWLWTSFAGRAPNRENNVGENITLGCLCSTGGPPESWY